MGTVLEAIGLSRAYPGHDGSPVDAVRDVTIHVDEGEVVGLVGRSGCGKSTLVMMLAGLLPATAGEVRYRGELLPRRVRKSRYRRAVQMVFQDPFSSLSPTWPIGRAVQEVMAVHRTVPAGDRRKEMERLLESVGIPAARAGERPASFSGGERQRIAIARALAANPEVVLCDEPVTALDVSIRGQILNLLADINRERGVAFLFVAHDLAVVRRFCSRVYVMEAGRIVEEGMVETVFAQPGSLAARELIAAIPELPENPAR